MSFDLKSEESLGVLVYYTSGRPSMYNTEIHTSSTVLEKFKQGLTQFDQTQILGYGELV